MLVKVLSLHKNINIKEINVINPVQSLNSCVPILFSIKDCVVESRFAVTVRDAKDNNFSVEIPGKQFMKQMGC